jgi:hypothetical protein
LANIDVSSIFFGVNGRGALSAAGPADGYTLFLANAANAINAMLYEKLDFNFIRDIAPVAASPLSSQSIVSGQDRSRTHRPKPIRVRSPWGRPSAFVPRRRQTRGAAQPPARAAAGPSSARRSKKRGAVQARDRIRSATARKFSQQIIDTIMVDS